jgi:malonate-semialdehyde dehydrogenase (acetylating) / methylmalonate-semialdehyde dehydrogenase
LPAGVFNLVHGDREAVDALLHHPLVKAVSFVGSTPVAKYIYTTAAAQGKRVQALGGAKNHLVVMPDADMPKTVEAIIGSAFGAAGERCLAGSVLVPVGDAAGPLLDLLVRAPRSLKVGDGSQAAWRWVRWSLRPLKRVAGYIEKALPKARTLSAGWTRRRRQAGGGYFLGPTIFDHVTPEMTIAREEIFGPVLSVMRVNTLDDAIDLVNRSPFGNATRSSLSSGKSRASTRRVEVGMVGVNVGVAAPWRFSRSRAGRIPSSAICTRTAKTRSVSTPSRR